jgi:hypothetical protein|tara:strand:+ start:1347 stop:1544 length:198 start_codon:yes stop_codon:yes gene_type:complete
MSGYGDGAARRPPRFQPPLPGGLPGQPYDPTSYGAQLAQRRDDRAPLALMIKGVVIGFILRTLLK